MFIKRGVVFVLSIFLSISITGCINYYSQSNDNYSGTRRFGEPNKEDEDSFREETSKEYDFLDFDINILDNYYKYDCNRDDVYYVDGVGIDEDEMNLYVGVLMYADEYWGSIYDGYSKPILVVYNGAINLSFDGKNDTHNGNFYSSGIVFIDVNQMNEIVPTAAGKAYILSHEVGHHMQNLMTTLDMVKQNEMKLIAEGNVAGANKLQVYLELQADYFAGSLASYLEKEDMYSFDDLVEAMTVSNSIGDDVILGDAYSVEESDHGTSQQRKKWFLRGYSDKEYRYFNIFEFDDDDLD